MGILSFLLSIAGDVVKELIVDFIREPNKREQQEEIQKLVAAELVKHRQSIPDNLPPEVLAKQVVEQIILLAANPNSPIKIHNGAIVLREPPLPRPLFTPKDKWTEKEVQARLWQLKQVIDERKREMQQIQAEPRVTSRLPPVSDDTDDTQKTQTGKRQDWESRLEETAARIDDRRQSELKPIEQTQEGKDAHS
jgi:hypothetical protein